MPFGGSALVRVSHVLLLVGRRKNRTRALPFCFALLVNGFLLYFCFENGGKGVLLLLFAIDKPLV